MALNSQFCTFVVKTLDNYTLLCYMKCSTSLLTLFDMLNHYWKDEIQYLLQSFKRSCLLSPSFTLLQYNSGNRFLKVLNLSKFHTVAKAFYI